jgi:hypothetical protein
VTPDCVKKAGAVRDCLWERAGYKSFGVPSGFASESGQQWPAPGLLSSRF